MQPSTCNCHPRIGVILYVATDSSGYCVLLCGPLDSVCCFDLLHPVCNCSKAAFPICPCKVDWAYAATKSLVKCIRMLGSLGAWHNFVATLPSETQNCFFWVFFTYCPVIDCMAEVGQQYTHCLWFSCCLWHGMRLMCFGSTAYMPCPSTAVRYA